LPRLKVGAPRPILKIPSIARSGRRFLKAERRFLKAGRRFL